MYSSVQQLRTKNLLNNLSKKTAKQAIPEIEEMMNNTVSDEKNVILSIIFDIDFRNLTMLPKVFIFHFLFLKKCYPNAWFLDT